jgi:hypothetical protein
VFVSQSVDGVIYVARVPQWEPLSLTPRLGNSLASRHLELITHSDDLLQREPVGIAGAPGTTRR